jgi:hypothetical protein
MATAKSLSGLAVAAALLGCENSGTGPVRTTSRGILADALAGTVSAHGAGVVVGFSCNSFCNEGGRGLSFRFDFTGPNTGTQLVTVTGTWSASDPATNVQLQYTGMGSVDPNVHILSARGPCNVTSGGNTTPGTCNLCAFDGSSSGAADNINFDGIGRNGLMQTVGSSTVPCFGTPPTSGNISID